jgi:hypothetical protein
MLKRDHEKRTGDDRYEGYSVDLLVEISKLVNFEYEIYLTPDNKFGGQDDDGNWDGLVQELMVGVSRLFCQ